MAKRKGRRNSTLSVNASAKPVRAVRCPAALPDFSVVSEGPGRSRVKLDRTVSTATALHIMKLLRKDRDSDGQKNPTFRCLRSLTGRIKETILCRGGRGHIGGLKKMKAKPAAGGCSEIQDAGHVYTATVIQLNAVGTIDVYPGKPVKLGSTLA
jgi:hypothetical protein